MLPTCLMREMAKVTSLPNTIAFSNTPGTLRSIHHKGTSALSMVNCFNSASKSSLTIAFISYVGRIRSSVTCDSGTMQEDPKVLIELLETAIEELLALGD